MVKSVLIARKSDGLIFCEESYECSNDKNLMSVRNKAIEYLKTMNNKQDMCTVNIGSQNFVFHYKINENIVYFVISDIKYSSKLAFCFLEELNEGFTDVSKNFLYNNLSGIEKSFWNSICIILFKIRNY